VKSAMLTEEPRVDDTMRRQVALFSKIHDCAHARRGVGVRHAAAPLGAAACGGLPSAQGSFRARGAPARRHCRGLRPAGSTHTHHWRGACAAGARLAASGALTGACSATCASPPARN
jgi:hypothetical protein